MRITANADNNKRTAALVWIRRIIDSLSCGLIFANHTPDDRTMFANVRIFLIIGATDHAPATWNTTGPYRVLEPLGEGGMGEVHKATDTRLNRTVAIKVLPQRFSEDLEMRQRFEREAKTIATLNHPHICTLYDVGNQDGVEFLVMEHLEGETLAARLTRGPLPIDEALSLRSPLQTRSTKRIARA